MSIYSSFKITLMVSYISNNKICFRSYLIPFFGIALLSTQITWILMNNLWEIGSSSGLYYTLVSGFGDLSMWIYIIWENYLLPVRESWSLTFLARYEYKFFHSLNILRYISLIFGVICSILEKLTTMFTQRTSLLMIIPLYMLWMKILLLVCYIPPNRLQIH